MKYNAIDRFYGVFNDSTQDNDDVKTLREAFNRLDSMLKEGQAGSIMTAQYLDHDTYEYEVLNIRYYIKTKGELVKVKEDVWEKHKSN